MLYCESADVIYSKKFVPWWLLAAFKAGFINSAGFLASGEFVSHVSGFGTRVGISLGHEAFLFGLELLIIPISFICGGIMTSFILDKQYRAGERPPYYIVQGLITLLIGVIIFMGESTLIPNTSFGEDSLYTVQEFIFIGILCFICGLKNSLVAWATYGKIKVTHLTGLSTDIGLNFIKMINPKRKSPRFYESPYINFIRILIFLMFSTGAMISAMMFPNTGYKSFFLVLGLSALMTCMSLFDYWGGGRKTPPHNEVRG